MNNKPVAWMDENENVIFEKNWAYPIPLYTHPVKEEAEQQSYQEADGCPTELAVLKRFWRQHNPVKPAICVGHWDNKTGAFHKHLTESQQKRVDEGFLKPVYTAGMFPVKELTLTDEEIKQLAYQHRWNGDVEFAKAILKKAQEK